MKHIKAEVITIGDEILYGQITDTNTQWISAELDKIGVKTVRKSSVGDDRLEITQILKESLQRADIVLITGGLGPTKDDITKKTIADFFDDKLVLNPEAYNMVEAFFANRGAEFTEINQQQAYLPSQSTFLPNAVGTAPGMLFEHDDKVIVSMPGVPFEMKYLMEKEVIPRIQKKFKTPVILHKMIRTVGIGESFLSTTIEDWELNLPKNIKLAYLPNLGQVRLRLTAVGSSKKDLQEQLEVESKKLYGIIGEYIYGEEEEELEQAIAKLLIANKATLSTAESCTGGYIAHSLTANPGSSAYYLGSVICYANEVKIEQLGVKRETLEEYGAVSEQTVTEMAEGAKARLKSTFAIATSGIAGPDGGSKEKPVGTIWIAISGPNKTVTKKILSTKTRLLNIKHGSKVALNLLRTMILNEI